MTLKLLATWGLDEGHMMSHDGSLVLTWKMNIKSVLLLVVRELSYGAVKVFVHGRGSVQGLGRRAMVISKQY